MAVLTCLTYHVRTSKIRGVSLDEEINTHHCISAWGVRNYYKSLEFEADGGSKSWRPDLQPQGLSFTYFLWFGHGLASSPVHNIKHLSASFPLRMLPASLFWKMSWHLSPILPLVSPSR